jgi:hypothetical protein
MLKISGLPIEFDFFMDEDTRSKRIGILVMEKTLAPALSQALFRIRQNASHYHMLKIANNQNLTQDERKVQTESISKQSREIKWSNLNLVRSFIAIEFIKHFFQYSTKGPLPIMFFNSPFITDHSNSINYFFDCLNSQQFPVFQNFNNSKSVFFLDSFNTPAGIKFEKEITTRNNLGRCYRLDSKAHDLIQMTDLLLALTVVDLQKKTIQSKAKLSLYKEFSKLREIATTKNLSGQFNWNPIYII